PALLTTMLLVIASGTWTSSHTTPETLPNGPWFWDTVLNPNMRRATVRIATMNTPPPLLGPPFLTMTLFSMSRLVEARSRPSTWWPKTAERTRVTPLAVAAIRVSWLLRSGECETTSWHPELVMALPPLPSIVTSRRVSVAWMHTMPSPVKPSPPVTV